MRRPKLLERAAQGFIFLSALALLSVSAMALKDPQSIMDLVSVKLTNNDAFSSIRGIYGGVSLTLVICLLYLMFHHVTGGLAFLSLLWGFYALSRIITIYSEGPLGSFGQQWLLIESTLAVIAIALFWAMKNAEDLKPAEVK
ncbi:DUF4345 domain-containing protein [Dyadobacter luticola]|uniref:DUF4345 domain-containing protein n=1 Tax=Dyadobacter luticola TaxID=1979387 RepID=A0A5R9L1S7_9BACT|nr:DUF4345 domain-containing protein [Dyadobacter luticola]TLV02506.1 DUF4345 domain-containing protein [Dyadobacter luticola]